MSSWNAVILTAGLGERIASGLKEDGGYYPKSLLMINGESILHRQIRLLKTKEIHDITIVVSAHPLYSKLTEEIKRNVEDDIRILEISFPFEKVEKCWTLFHSKDYFRDHTIILLGDVIFDEETLDEIFSEPFEDILFIGNSSPTNWCQRGEIWLLLINSKGTTILKDIKNPFIVERTKEKEWRWEKSKLGLLFRHFEPRKKIFCPKNFILDVDYLEDLEMARKYLGGKKDGL